ncbi:MAG: ribose-phosphate pyrophosphokinase [Spirochaetales bacterium]|nr:ribose-phosphate pyrophosphokinase [Spirochaetales bacterium]
MNTFLIVGNTADNPFVDDIAHHIAQQEDYSDLISLKSFLNTEFCPRFLVDERNFDDIGNQLQGKTVLIVSTTLTHYTRDELAMRNFLIIRAAKDNGAQRVILLEPDLFYSAQDRGPRNEHGLTGFKRDLEDYKKFDGQPFSARIYADLLKQSGVDDVFTVHNHSCSVQSVFMDRLSGRFHNAVPADLYAHYIFDSDVIDENKLVICAPDRGARPFAEVTRKAFPFAGIPLITIDKERLSEQEINVRVAQDSEIGLKDLSGKDVVVFDDMVRTGHTIVECCRLLRKGNPRRIVFFVTHFYSSREGRIYLNDPVIDEIVTTDTIPGILNRDVQGRLRHKLVVLKIERWIAAYILGFLFPQAEPLKPPLYTEDMSSKNPRWKGRMGPLLSNQDWVPPHV